MRPMIKLRCSFRKHADGTLTKFDMPTAEEQDEAQRRSDEYWLQHAINRFHSDRTLEPLIRQLEQRNPALLSNREAINLLARAARGERLIGKGRVLTEEETLRRTQICKAIAWLRHIGVPIKNAADKNRVGTPQKMSACCMIANITHRSEESIYSIWRKDGRFCSIKGAFEIGPPWRWDGGRIPSADEILRHYVAKREPFSYFELAKELGSPLATIWADKIERNSLTAIWLDMKRGLEGKRK